MKGVYCIEKATRGSLRGVTYGCTRRLEDAIAALERGRRRGVTWGDVIVRKSAPRVMRMDTWLTPFDERRAGFR